MSCTVGVTTRTVKMSKKRTRTDLDISKQYEVVNELEKGISQTKVAEKFGISQSKLQTFSTNKKCLYINHVCYSTCIHHTDLILYKCIR